MQRPGLSTAKASLSVDIGQLIEFGQLDAFYLGNPSSQCEDGCIESLSSRPIEAVKEHIHGHRNAKVVIVDGRQGNMWGASQHTVHYRAAAYRGAQGTDGI